MPVPAFGLILDGAQRYLNDAAHYAQEQLVAAQLDIEQQALHGRAAATR
ncbi:MAG: hypothetical protein R3E31_07695 [Chloroflexota bacterium]